MQSLTEYKTRHIIRCGNSPSRSQQVQRVRAYAAIETRYRMIDQSIDTNARNQRELEEAMSITERIATWLRQRIFGLVRVTALQNDRSIITERSRDANAIERTSTTNQNTQAAKRSIHKVSYFDRAKKRSSFAYRIRSYSSRASSAVGFGRLTARSKSMMKSGAYVFFGDWRRSKYNRFDVIVVVVVWWCLRRYPIRINRREKITSNEPALRVSCVQCTYGQRTTTVINQRNKLNRHRRRSNDDNCTTNAQRITHERQQDTCRRSTAHRNTHKQRIDDIDVRETLADDAQCA